MRTPRHRSTCNFMLLNTKAYHTAGMDSRSSIIALLQITFTGNFVRSAKFSCSSRTVRARRESYTLPAALFSSQGFKSNKRERRSRLRRHLKNRIKMRQLSLVVQTDEPHLSRGLAPTPRIRHLLLQALCWLEQDETGSAIPRISTCFKRIIARFCFTHSLVDHAVWQCWFSILAARDSWSVVMPTRHWKPAARGAGSNPKQGRLDCTSSHSWPQEPIRFARLELQQKRHQTSANTGLAVQRINKSHKIARF